MGDEGEEAGAAGAGLPEFAEGHFLVGDGALSGGVALALVFDDEVVAVGEFGDEVRVELVGGGLQPESVFGAAFENADPMFDLGVVVADGEGAETLEGVEGARGAGVVGFVHDDEGMAEADELGQRRREAARFGGVGEFVDLDFGQAGEGGHKVAVLVVDAAVGGIFDVEAGEGGDDDDGGGVKGVALEVEGFIEGKDGDVTGEILIEGLAIGVGAVAEGLEGLIDDGVGGGEPEGEEVVLAE